MKKVIVIIALTILAIVNIVVITAKAETDAICVVHRGEWVWVRNAPDPDAEQIDKIRYGYEVKISEIVNGYAHIASEWHNGWVDVSYLEIPIDEKIYKVVSDGPLNKRETPDGRYMTKIKSGVNISVLGWRYSKSGELWAKVYHGGYVKAAYLAEVE